MLAASVAASGRCAKTWTRIASSAVAAGGAKSVQVTRSAGGRSPDAETWTNAPESQRTSSTPSASAPPAATAARTHRLARGRDSRIGGESVGSGAGASGSNGWGAAGPESRTIPARAAAASRHRSEAGVSSSDGVQVDGAAGVSPGSGPAHAEAPESSTLTGLVPMNDSGVSGSALSTPPVTRSTSRASRRQRGPSSPSTISSKSSHASCAFCVRWVGSLTSSCSIQSEIRWSTSGRMLLTGAIGSLTWRSRIAIGASESWNGTLPVNDSNAMQPTEYRSVQGPMSCAIACSGAM